MNWTRHQRKPPCAELLLNGNRNCLNIAARFCCFVFKNLINAVLHILICHVVFNKVLAILP